MQTINQADFDRLQHLLPPSFAQILTIVGIEAAFKLVDKLGGTSFPIGQNRRQTGKVLHFALAEIIGEELASRVETAFLGQREIYIPKCDALKRELRNAAIRAEFDELTTRSQHRIKPMLAAKNLARAYHISERWVWEILNNPSDMQQNDLFSL